MKDNRKVPVAVLSCFLIAFLLQGILKLCGVFVFEKALDWEIFKIIDNTKWLAIIYYSIINLIPIYCLSFVFSSKPYSKKWYHYIIIIVSAFAVTSIRMLVKTPAFMEFIYDVAMYIITPVIISLTLDKDQRLFDKLNIHAVITTLSLHIMLYFFYLGLGYWSNVLNSMMPTTQVVTYASSMFLIMFEMYVGLALLMISMNMCIYNYKDKGGLNMNWPANIASQLAKAEAKQVKLETELAKLDEKRTAKAKEVEAAKAVVAELKSKQDVKKA